MIMLIKRFAVIFLIFIFAAVDIFAQTNENNTETDIYEGSQYIKSEEEAKAAYSLALYYRERASASKTATQETMKDLESAKVILLEVLKYIKNKEIYITLAETYESLSEYYESSKIYDKLVLDNPEDIELLVKAAERNIFILGNFKKAKYYLQTAYEIDNTNNDALILLGFSYYENREFEKAVFYFNKVDPAKKASNNYMEYYNFYYGMSEFYLSRFSSAIKRLEKIKNISLSVADGYSTYYGIVKSYQALEKYYEAYTNSIKINDALFLSAYLSFMSDKFNKELFDEIDTSSAQTPKILSIILESKNTGYSNALNMIETDLDRKEIDLDIMQTYYKMVNEIGDKTEKINSEMDIISFYLMLNNIDALPNHIEKLISYENTGKFNSLYLQAALEFKNQNNFKSSKEMIEKYLSLNNNSIKENELVSLVITANEIGESDLAIKAAEMFEKEKYSYSYLKAYSYLFVNDTNNVNKYLKEDLKYFENNKSNTNDYRINIPYIAALKIKNKDSALLYANYQYNQNISSAQNMNSLAWALVSLDLDLDKAIELSKNAVKLEPRSAHYMDTLGFAYYKKGDYNNALKTLLKATLYSDEYSQAEIYHHLADAYYAKKDYKNALKYYRKSLSSIQKEIDYDENSIKEKIKNLTEIK